MERQDKQGVRTPQQLEQKYRFGKTFAEVMGIATDAQTKAEEAEENVEKLDKSLTPEEVFNRLTDNGKAQAIYRDENGQIYINATYIKIGELVADLIKSGVLQSKDGSAYFDLDKGKLRATIPCQTIDDHGSIVDATLTVSMESGSIRFFTEELDGLYQDRLTLGINPMAPIDGSSPGCNIMDGFGESDYPRGLAVSPYGNLWLLSHNGHVVIGQFSEHPDRNRTEILGNQVIISSKDGEINMDGNRITHIADAVVDVTGGTAFDFSLKEGEAANFTYVTSTTSNSNVTMQVNGADADYKSYHYGSENWSNGTITSGGGSFYGNFTGTLRMLNGEVHLAGSGLRGNGSGVGTAVMVWDNVTEVTTLTFSQPGKLAYRHI